MAINNSNDNFNRLQRAAEAAQQAGRDLEQIFRQLESRQESLMQTSLKLSLNWIKNFAELDERGRSLLQLLTQLVKNWHEIGRTPPIIPPGAGPFGRNGGMMSGGYGQFAQPPINIQFMQNLPFGGDAASMRGEAQLSALIARAVSHGLRQL